MQRRPVLPPLAWAFLPYAVASATHVVLLAIDTILALRLFLPDSLPSWSSPAVMLTYTLGQGLIVAGAVASLRSPIPLPATARKDV